MEEKAIEEIEELVKENNSDAMVELATRYFTGKGVQKDFKLALRYFEKAETAGNIKGSYGIAKCYFYGRGLKQDYEKAAYYFEKSLDERYDDAYFHLGQIYKNGGYGIEKNTQKSRYYLLKVEKDICQATLYYIMGLGQYDLKIWIETLNYDKNYFGKLLKNYMSIMYFNKLKTLKDDQYKQMAEIIKNKITKFYEQKQPYFSLDVVTNEEEVDILSEIIIDSSEYNTMDDYLKIKLDQENDKRLLYMVGCILYEGINCPNDIQEGTNCFIKSAKQGYPYAIFKIAEIEYYKNNKIEALEKLNSLLNEKDEFLLKNVKKLLEKIYYCGDAN